MLGSESGTRTTSDRVPRGTNTDHPWIGYTLAIVGPLVAAAMRQELIRNFGDIPPYITHYLFTVLSAVYGGFWAGLLATALSAVTVTVSVLAPGGDPTLFTPNEVIGLSLFCAINLAISLVGGHLRSARRRAEHEARLARAAEEAKGSILARMIDSYIALDNAWRVFDLNPEAERVLHVTRENLLGRNVWEAFPGGEAFRVQYERARAEQTPVRFEEFYAPLNKWLEVSACPVGDRLSLFFRDVTQRHRAEAELAESEQRLRAIMDNANVAVWLKDLDGRFRMINRFTESLLGKAARDVLGHTVFDLFPREVAEQYDQTDQAVLRAGQPQESEEKFLGVGGPRIFLSMKFLLCDVQGHPYALCAFGREITARKHAEQERDRLESELRLAQKMESIGRLAGGVAHDFNNLLTGIIGNIELAEDWLRAKAPQAADVLGALTRVQNSAQSAAQLTRQLLSFSRRQVIQPRLIDLNEVLGDLAKTLTRLLREDIQLTLRLDPRLPKVCVDAGQLEQVVMNLVTNAQDAMPKGGRLLLATDMVVVDESNATPQTQGCRGPYARITVSDTGCGMDAQTLANIFEPFFTTKPMGRGTGLGLASVYGAVHQAGGAITVDSTLGVGSTFHVLLPAAADSIPSSAREPGPGEGPRGTETILLCEDDRKILEVMARALRAKGYTVITAASGEEALKAADVNGDIALLATDVIMPGMSGRQLAETLGAGRPHLRTLYISGYPAHVIGEFNTVGGDPELLAKPFRIDVFLQRVRDILDRVPDAPRT